MEIGYRIEHKSELSGPRAAQLCTVLAVMVLGSLTLNLLLCTTGFFIGKPISVFQPGLAAGAVFILSAIWLMRYAEWRLKRITLLFLSFALIFIVPVILASHFRDVSCDGQTYQGSAVAKLAAGWNPIKDPENIDPVRYDWTLNNILRFPKAHWIAEAAIVKLTGNLEAGKALHLILATVSFLLTLLLLLELGRSSLSVSVVLALLVALNPVTVNQLLSYYNDGQVSSLLISFVVCSIYLVIRFGAAPLLLLGMITVNLSNLKFSALGLLGILGAIYCLALLTARPGVQALKIIAVLAGALAVGVLFVGYNAYVINFRLGGHPFYPFNSFSMSNPMWAAQEVHQTPANFRGRGPVHTLLLSVFSASSNEFVAEGRTVGPGHLKVPFTVSWAELKSFSDVDTKVSGWGPLFGGIVLLTAIALVLMLRRRQPRGPLIVLLLLLAAITISVLALPDHWNARYAPHLCLIPLAVVIYIILWQTGGVRWFAWLIAATMAVNVLLIAGPCFWASFTKTRALNQQLAELVTRKEPVQVCFGELHFNRARFNDLGIKYHEVPFSPDARGTPLAGFLPQAQTTIYSALPEKELGD